MSEKINIGGSESEKINIGGGGTSKSEKNNIFDDFSTDSNLVQEVQKMKKETEKDLFFYASKSTVVLQILFWILLVLVFFSMIYIYLQKDETKSNLNYFSSICSVFNGETKSPNDICSSVAYANAYYSGALAEETNKQTKKLSNILPKLYGEVNFIDSKEVAFLLDKSKNRFQVIQVLEEFDKLKNTFVSGEKTKISCGNLTLTNKDKLLSMTCEAYSRGYEAGIMGFEVDKTDTVSGTSISVANSFLNYLESKSRFENGFMLVDRQKIFDSSQVFDKGYTNKTSFEVKLKINF